MWARTVNLRSNSRNDDGIRWRSAVGWAVVCLAASVFTGWGQSSLSALGEQTSRDVKIRVKDRRLGARIEAVGGEQVADYGGFCLYRVGQALADMMASDAAVELVPHQDVIELNAGWLDTTRAEVRALRRPLGNGTGKRLHLIQFAGPVKPEWRKAVEGQGVSVVAYVPQNAYLVYGPGTSLSRLQAWCGAVGCVQWEGQYLDGYKVHPGARVTDADGQPRTQDTDQFVVQLVEDSEANSATLAWIDRWKREAVRRDTVLLNYRTIVVRLPPERVSELAAQPEVVSIQPYHVPKKLDERQGQIVAGNLAEDSPAGPGYLAWLTSKGFNQAQFTASEFVVDITDSGVDNGTVVPGHFGLYPGDLSIGGSRVVYNRLEGTPNDGSTTQGCDGHGTLNAHILAGYSDQPFGFPHTDGAGYQYGLGVCPFVKIGCSVIFDPDTFTYPDYPSLQSRAYDSGARINSNSWGQTALGAGNYDADSQMFDALVRDAQPNEAAVGQPGNQPMVILFAAGNDGADAQTVGSPGTAKNVITVGASENVRSLSTTNGGNTAFGKDGCSPSLSDADANSACDMATFSSRGPCRDGRHKPDLVAPGTHITGGVGQEGPASAAGTGYALGCFSASGICALAGSGSVGSGFNFFPLGQQFYTVSSGTSHAAPAVAGACALLRQFFVNRGWRPPSPAATKAWLMNSSRYLAGAGAGDSLWSESQGMGAVDLGRALDGVPRVCRDQVAADKFTATGQTRTFAGTILDPTTPFRVTLAWTDAPGNTTGNAYNNDLDVTVTVGGNTYRGNVFAGAYSVPGGAADARNNVESVFLPAGTCGDFEVTVTAANINSDGVPNEAPDLDQDFALVIYNAATGLAACFNAAPAAGASPLTVEFVDRSIGEITNRFWDFGNGVTTNTTATHFTFTYATVGTNTVTLAVSGPAGTNSLILPGCVIVTNPTPEVVQDGFQLVGEACPNEAIDPGEKVAIEFRLRNVGSAETTNLIATLLATGGVLSPSPPQTYGVLSADEAVSRRFELLATGNCGESATATFRLDDGGKDLGTIAFDLPLGRRRVLVEAFDGSTTAWPAGWTTTGEGAQPVWVVVTNTPTTGPAAFSAEMSDVGINELVSDGIDISGVDEVRLSFRHRYGFEAGSGTSGFDGGVLEMRIEDGPFEDIVAAGGRFVAGGYTHTLSSAFGNPLGGCRAWSGDSRGPISTVVKLPETTLGRRVWFRWRCATDQDTGGAGWYVDGIVLSGALCCAAMPVVTNQVQNFVAAVGESIRLEAGAVGSYPLSYQWSLDGVAICGATDAAYTRSGLCIEDAGTYSVEVTNWVGSATGQIGVVQIINPPRLLQPQLDTNGCFRFVLSGAAGFNYLVEGTANWMQWEPLGSLSNATGLVPYVETNEPSLLFRAYRARLLPKP